MQAQNTDNHNGEGNQHHQPLSGKKAGGQNADAQENSRQRNQVPASAHSHTISSTGGTPAPCGPDAAFPTSICASMVLVQTDGEKSVKIRLSPAKKLFFGQNQKQRTLPH